MQWTLNSLIPSFFYSNQISINGHISTHIITIDISQLIHSSFFSQQNSLTTFNFFTPFLLSPPESITSLDLLTVHLCLKTFLMLLTSQSKKNRRTVKVIHMWTGQRFKDSKLANYVKMTLMDAKVMCTWPKIFLFRSLEM